jgi:hypothetical protein
MAESWELSVDRVRKEKMTEKIRGVLALEKLEG